MWQKNMVGNIILPKIGRYIFSIYRLQVTQNILWYNGTAAPIPISLAWKYPGFFPM